MSKEIIAGIKSKLSSMQKIEAAGFGDSQKAAAYFQEKELFLEDIVKTLEAVAVGQEAETEALKATVKSLRDELKGAAANPRELSRRELKYRLGKAIAAAWNGNHAALAELAFTPNLKADNWTNPHDVKWGDKGWVVDRAALGAPMGNMATNDQYLINPVYETDLASARGFYAGYA
jgi:hypothetical protein